MRAHRGLGLMLLLSVMMGGGHLLTAQDAPSNGSRAARLSFVTGKVQVLSPNDAQGDNPSQAAQTNLPLVEGQQIVAGDDGQAEIEFEDGSVARLTPNSSLTLVRLNTEQGRFLTQMDVASGMAYLELRVSGQYGYYVTAAGQGITPVENATFRVSLDQTPSEIAVMQGSVHVERDGGFSTNVKASETLKADAQDPARYFLAQEFRKDSWDQWNEERDQQAAQEAAQRTEARDQYASDAGYGWSDLDANGSWYDVPEVGRVWQPPMATDPNWDPYGYGNWVWYPGMGYVWASGYNWGWTPYRCGNWSFWDGFGWGWMPGSGCGVRGWGGRGGAFVVNVVNPPRFWRPIGRPIPGPGRIHPIVPVRRGPIPLRAGGPGNVQRPVNFGGRTLQPLRPVGPPNTPRGGSVIGSSLRRDFPVDSKTRQPVMGVVRTQPVDGRERPIWNPADGRAGEPIQRPVTTPPVPGGGWRQVNPGNTPQNGQGQSRPGRDTQQVQPRPPAAGQPRPADQPQPQPQQPRPMQRGPVNFDQRSEPRPAPPPRPSGPPPSAPPPAARPQQGPPPAAAPHR